MEKPVIICVDDEHFVLSSLGEQLRRHLGDRCEIELVDDPRDVFDLLAELTTEGLTVPLIISDQCMAVIGGDELLAQVHQQYPKILTMLLTGQTNAANLAHAVNAADLYRYIPKPWDEMDLILTVKEALRRFEQEHQLAQHHQALELANQELQRSVSLLSATLESTADGIAVLDVTGRLIAFNQRFGELWQGMIVDPPQIGRSLADLFVAHPHVLQQIQLLQSESLSKAEAFEVVCLTNGRFIECFAQPQRIQDATAGWVYSFRDITERKRAEAQIHHQANHDALTNLPNRLRFQEYLEEALDFARVNQECVAVVFIDLDRFKLVNDTLGHAIGDQLLQQMVCRFRQVLRSQDLLARWGGDEFTLLLPYLHTREDVNAIAQRLLAVMKPSFDLDGHPVRATASLGIAMFPEDGKDAATLLKNADAALYRVKEQGRNDFQHYSLTINAQAYELLALETDLHRALEQQEFVVYYQPQIDSFTGQITQMEALIRWQHPTMGMVAPGLFIALAEQNGLIVPIGEWILQTAAQQCQTWHHLGYSELKVGVNLSVKQLRHRDFAQVVKRILDQTGLPPNHLELEITETAAMENIELTQMILGQLQAYGVQIALDDFGTGYSSLGYLKQLPFHTLKVDQSFVRDLGTTPKNVAIVKAILGLAQGLELQVVAEGVETAELRDLLGRLGCSTMQGYYFSKPLPAEAATTLLATDHPEWTMVRALPLNEIAEPFPAKALAG
jgi:diguanylate cyclase (GGDEF)-like protein/PAS domain S-box-containing protein